MRIEYTSNYRDFADAQKLHRRSKPTYEASLLVFGFFAVLGAVILIHGLLTYGFTGLLDHHVTDFACGVFLVLLPVFYWANFIYSIRRGFRLTSTGQVCAIDFESDGLRMIGEHSKGEILWSAFHSFVEGPRCFLLYLAPGRFLSVPKRLLDGAKLPDFRSLLSEKIGRTGIPSTVKTSDSAN